MCHVKTQCIKILLLISVIGVDQGKLGFVFFSEAETFSNRNMWNLNKLKKDLKDSKLYLCFLIPQESILPNYFLCKTKIFLLLSLSVCRMRKYCLYFKIAKFNSKNWKNEEIKVLVGLTPGHVSICRECPICLLFWFQFRFHSTSISAFFPHIGNFQVRKLGMCNLKSRVEPDV
jgi:hypothetical protein